MELNETQLQELASMQTHDPDNMCMGCGERPKFPRIIPSPLCRECLEPWPNCSVPGCGNKTNIPHDVCSPHLDSRILEFILEYDGGDNCYLERKELKSGEERFRFHYPVYPPYSGPWEKSRHKAACAAMEKARVPSQ